MQSLHRFLLAIFPCFLAISNSNSQQNAMPPSFPPSSIMRRNLISTWDGTTPIAPYKVVPVIFSIEAKTPDAVVVTFNSTSFTTDDDKFVTPMVFGVMFEGDDHIHLQVEVQNGGASKVELYDMGKMIQPKEPLHVDYHVIPSINGTWNGSISIPAKYFPRATRKYAVYANFTKAPHDTLIYSLQKIKATDFIREILPNLHKPDFFEEIEMHKYVPMVDFSHWSEMWQELLDVTAGGTHLPSNSTITHKQSSPSSASSLVHSAFAIIAALCLAI